MLVVVNYLTLLLSFEARNSVRKHLFSIVGDDFWCEPPPIQLKQRRVS